MFQRLAVNWIYKAGVYTRLCDNIYSDIMSLLGYFDASDRFFGIQMLAYMFAYIFLSLVNQNSSCELAFFLDSAYSATSKLVLRCREPQ